MMMINDNDTKILCFLSTFQILLSRIRNLFRLSRLSYTRLLSTTTPLSIPRPVVTCSNLVSRLLSTRSTTHQGLYVGIPTAPLASPIVTLLNMTRLCTRMYTLFNSKFMVTPVLDFGLCNNSFVF
jgi:hypothetical protein